MTGTEADRARVQTFLDARQTDTHTDQLARALLAAWAERDALQEHIDDIDRATGDLVDGRPRLTMEQREQVIRRLEEGRAEPAQLRAEIVETIRTCGRDHAFGGAGVSVILADLADRIAAGRCDPAEGEAP